MSRSQRCGLPRLWGMLGLCVWLVMLPLPTRAAEPPAPQSDTVRRFNFKLSGDLVAGGNVTNLPRFQLSPDGRTAVFVADKETDNTFELYSVPVRGGTPVRLSGPPVGGSSVVMFRITSDSRHVVYRVSGGSLPGAELYSVPIGGGTPVKLNGPLLGAGFNTGVGFFLITPDDAQVVYAAPQDTAGQMELYRVPLAGGANQKVSGPLTETANVSVFGLSNDGATVVYSVFPDSGVPNDLYSVPLVGGTAVRLNDPVAENFMITTFRIAPDDSRVVYSAANQASFLDGRSTDFYSVPLQGGTIVTLDSGFSDDVTLSWDYFFTPDSSRVIYALRPVHTEPFRLYSVPAGGGSVVRLDDPAQTGGVGLRFQVTPDGATVLYTAQHAPGGQSNLFRVAAGGGPSTRLNDPLPGASLGVQGSLHVAPGGSHVAYGADQETAGRAELYLVPVGGGTVTKLSGPMVAGGNVNSSQVQFSADGSRVTYMADQETDGVAELFQVPVSGGPGFKVNGSLVAGGTVSSFNWLVSQDNHTVVYRADQDVDNRFELYGTFEIPIVFVPLLRR